MTEVNATQNSNLALSNWLYGVQEIPTQNYSHFSGLGTEIAQGIPFIIGIPLITQYSSKYYQTYKGMQNTPNTTFFQAWKDLNNATAYLKDDKSIFQTFKNKHQYGNLINYEKELPKFNAKTDVSKLSPKKLIKYENSKIASSYYDEAKKLIQEAKDKKMTGTELKEQLKKVREAIRKGDLKYNEAIQNGTIKQTSSMGKLSHLVKTKTGVYKAEGKLLKTNKGASALKFAKKGIKGTWVMAAIEGVLELPEIIKAYKIDEQEKKAGNTSNRGNKQVLKSTTKVGSGILGYALGSAAAGAAVGSICPGIGNAVGAAVGFIGGLIGSALFSWGAEKVMDAALNEKDSLNKTETDIYSEEKNNEKKIAAKALAEKADKSKSIQEQLLMATAQKADEEGGFDDQTTLNAFKDLIQKREKAIEQERQKRNFGPTQYIQTPQNEYAQIINQLNGIINLTS